MMNSLKNGYREVIHDIHGVSDYLKYYRLFKPYQVKLYNWFTFAPYEWIPRFIYERGILKNTKKTLSIFSVFGRRINIKIDRSDYKIFYTGENVYSRFQEYDDLLLNENRIGLSIGFDYLSNKKFFRFPIWLMNIFDPDETIESIKRKCDSLNSYEEVFPRHKFCSFLSSHDYFGTRTYFFQEVSKVDKIECGGSFMKNSNELQERFNNNKFEYLKYFKYNLCPENSNYPGYCTEKLFEAIKSGCIPIYWGSDNDPEPDILNHRAVFFLSENGGNESVLESIRKLAEDTKVYSEFASQKRLSDNAHEIIFGYFSGLEKRLIDLVNS